jgi:hypothetical protein
MTYSNHYETTTYSTALGSGSGSPWSSKARVVLVEPTTARSPLGVL